MKYLIKNFGNDRECNTSDEVIQTLRAHYAGQSVTVQISEPPFGMQSSVFVDVPEKGGEDIVDTYTGKPITQF